MGKDAKILMKATIAANPSADAVTATAGDPLLHIVNLKTYFDTEEGVVRSVDGVDLDVRAGQTLGVVGESGCGKSVTALSVLKLIQQPPGKIVDGQILFGGVDLLTLSDDAIRKIRGNDISIIFQEPMTSINPVFTVGFQIIEAITLHQRIGRRAARRQAIELLRLVGIPLPEQRIDDYPHQMSGGMRQRVMIAIALSCQPRLLIADEPTTALDVTIQAQILALIRDLQVRLGTAVMLITHDLGVIAENSDEVVVMYLGKVVERAHVYDLFEQPLHPYTRGLLQSMPRPDTVRGRLPEIPGAVPNPHAPVTGCRFHPRCAFAVNKCRAEEPDYRQWRNEHWARCWRVDEIAHG